MRRSDATEDLFRPTLTEADDDHGFAGPWSPYVALWAAFLGGLPAAGWLLAENFRRLGLRSWAVPSLIGALVSWVVASLGIVVWYTNGPLEAGERSLMRILLQALAVGFAGLVSMRQRRRWQLYQTLERPAGKPWMHLVAAIPLSWLASLMLVSFLYAKLRSNGSL